jgi:ribose transport system substrate-binding protein
MKGFGFNLLSALACAGALALAACGDSGTNPSAGGGGGGSSGDEIVIGYVAKSSDNPVFMAAHKGAQDAAAELSKSTGKKISVKILTPPKEDGKAQADAIDSLVRSGAAGIAVSASTGDVTEPINKAVAKGIAVICFDSDAPESKRMAYFGTNDIDGGTKVAQLLAKEMGDTGMYAIIAGNEAAPNLRKRVQGVHDEMKKHPNMKEKPGGPVYHAENPAAAAQALQDAQRANPEIKGWALVGGWPLFTSNALPWKPGEVKVVSFDALPEQIAYLESGHVNILLAQDCYGWGHKSVNILVDKIVNKKDPSSTMIFDPLTEVTKANAAQWSENWKKWK